jgi:hypothetical protein
MSRLRKQLETAQREYHAARYPGDLAAEVLRPARRWGRWVGLASTLAAAAVVAVFVLLRFPDRENDTLVIVPGQNPPEQLVIEIAPSFSPSEMGSDEALSVPASDFSFSMPTISFVQEGSPEGTSTTQETVS